MMENINSIRLPKGHNKHHLFWMKRDYLQTVDRTFRNFEGLVIGTPIVNHNLLHSRLAPPPKPERANMVDLMDILESTHPSEKYGRWGAIVAEDYFNTLGQTELSPERAERAIAISEHLTAQIGYLSLKIATAA